MLKTLGLLDWTAISDQINHHLQEYFAGRSSLVIAGFSQHQFEPDIMSYLQFWHQQGGVCCLPVIVGPDQALAFRQWNVDKPLVKGVYDIWTPPETEPEVIPDVLLVPLVAFGPFGARLGRGGGYYDRTIKALRGRVQKPQVIGVAAHQQFIEFLETNPHDEPLDGVVTDKGIWSEGFR